MPTETAPRTTTRGWWCLKDPTHPNSRIHPSWLAHTLAEVEALDADGHPDYPDDTMPPHPCCPARPCTSSCGWHVCTLTPVE